MSLHRQRFSSTAGTRPLTPPPPRNACASRESSHLALSHLEGHSRTLAHPTQKPLVLFETPIRNHLKSGEGVYDPFLVSGTCLMAAERQGARCYALEIDPLYVEVALQRWERFSGEEAVRVDERAAHSEDDEDSPVARSGRLRARWPERHAQEVRRDADSTEADRRAARSSP